MVSVAGGRFGVLYSTFHPSILNTIDFSKSAAITSTVCEFAGGMFETRDSSKRDGTRDFVDDDDDDDAGAVDGRGDDVAEFGREVGFGERPLGEDGRDDVDGDDGDDVDDDDEPSGAVGRGGRNGTE